MKKGYILFVFLFVTCSLHAQQSLDIGLAGGTTNYFGDLGNDEFFQKSSMSPGMAITVRNFISPRKLPE